MDLRYSEFIVNISVAGWYHLTLAKIIPPYFIVIFPYVIQGKTAFAPMHLISGDILARSNSMPRHWLSFS